MFPILMSERVDHGRMVHPQASSPPLFLFEHEAICQRALLY